MPIETYPPSPDLAQGLSWAGKSFSQIDTLVADDFTPDAVFFQQLQSEVMKLIRLTAPADVRNWLLNPFSLAQRQDVETLTAIADEKYGPDRWRLTRESDGLQFARADATTEYPELNARHYGRFVKSGGAGKVLIYQPLEGYDTAPLRGRTVRFQARLRGAEAHAMRMALLAWTSSEDAIPAALVSAWGAAGADPTLASGYNVIAVAAAGVTTGWQEFAVEGEVPSTARNLIAACWSDAQFNADEELHAAEPALYRDSGSRRWYPRPQADELRLCQRYYEKSFPADYGPAQNFENSPYAASYYTPIAGAHNSGVTVFFKNTKRTPPAMAAYNTNNANANWWNHGQNADSGAPFFDASPDKALISNPQVSGDAAGDFMTVHWTADAEL